MKAKAPIKLAQQVGIAHAEHLFELFQVPGYRGENFRWANFPDLVGDMAKSGVPMSVAVWDKLDEKQRSRIRSAAKESAMARAKQLLTEKPQKD